MSAIERGTPLSKASYFDLYCAIIGKRCEKAKLLLFINRKSHTGFRLVLTSVTLNDLE